MSDLQILIRRRKPVTVEMVEVTQDNLHEAAAWSGGQVAGNGSAVWVDTANGELPALIGDYIVRGNGEFYPAPAEAIEAGYER